MSPQPWLQLYSAPWPLPLPQSAHQMAQSLSQTPATSLFKYLLRHFVPKPGSGCSACCPRAMAEALPAHLPAHALNTHSAVDPESWPTGPSLLPTHRPLYSLPPTLGMSPLTFSPFLPGSLSPTGPHPSCKECLPSWRGGVWECPRCSQAAATTL